MLIKVISLTTLLVFVKISISHCLPSSKNTFSYPNYRRDDESSVNGNEERFKESRTRIIRIKQGMLRGRIVHFKNNNDLHSAEVFLGIPYAAAPTGSQRFMPPGSPPSWSGVMSAEILSPVCPQVLPDVSDNARSKMSKGRYNYFMRLLPYLRNQSEDCLFLNIYAPSQDHLRSITPKLPVIVFIHGESFEWNSGNPYDGSILASYGNVIVVTINFRLGILGFLKPGVGEHTVSNFGLLDQIASLQWIKDNIQHFGGDSDSVTVMGHGTGAACTNFLMVSPVSGANGLFHRAILMSGSALADWALTSNPEHVTIQVAEALNCPETSNEMASCLRRKRLSELMAVQVNLHEFKTAFGPVIDGNVVPNQPGQVMGVYKDLFSRYELMYGVTEFERYHMLDAVSLAHGMLADNRNKILRSYMRERFEALPDVAFARTISQYSNRVLPEHSRSAAEHNRDILQQVFSDSMVIAPLVQTAAYHAQANSKSYFYVFTHRSKFSDFPSAEKSVHGEELAYVMGIPLGGPSFHFQGNYNAPEKLLSEVMIILWTNFAKTGSPNLPQKHGYFTQKEWRQFNVQWPEYDAANQSYLQLDIPPTIGHHYRQDMMSYWNQILPQVLENPQRQPIQRPHSTKSVPPFLDPALTKRYEGEKQPSWGTIEQEPMPVYKFADTAETTPKFDNFDAYSNFPFRPIKKKEDRERSDKEVYGTVVHEETKSSNNVIMDRPGFEDESALGVFKKDEQTTVQSASMTPSITATAAMIGCICFLLLNTCCFVAICVQKSKLKVRERLFNNRFRCTGNRSDDYDIEDRYMKKIDDTEESDFRMDSSDVRKENETCKPLNKTNECLYEPFKIASIKAKAERTGKKRRKWGVSRQPSSSTITIDPHTKVREWFTQEIVSRCSPKFLRRKKNQKHNKPTTADAQEQSFTAKTDGGGGEKEEIYKSTKFLESSSSVGKSKPSFSIAQTALKMENPYATKEEIYGSRNQERLLYGSTKNKEEIYGSKGKTPAAEKNKEEIYGSRNRGGIYEAKLKGDIYNIRKEGIYGTKNLKENYAKQRNEKMYGSENETISETDNAGKKEVFFDGSDFPQTSKEIAGTVSGTASNDLMASLKPKAKKVNVAVDATPATRTGSVLKQIPIELTKSLDEGKSVFCSTNNISLSSSSSNKSSLKRNNAVSESDISFTGGKQNRSSTVRVQLGSSSDNFWHIKAQSDSFPLLSPLTCGEVIDIELNPKKESKSKVERTPEILQSFSSIQFKKVIPKALTNQKSCESGSHYEDINVTSRITPPPPSEDSETTSEECLDNIKKRNFPKVLPDFPSHEINYGKQFMHADVNMKAKRMSLPPNAQVLASHSKRIEFLNRKDGNRIPPPPPPRISTLGRKPNIKPINTALNIKLASMKKDPQVKISDAKNISPSSIPKNSEMIKITATNKPVKQSAQVLQLRKEPKIIIKSNACQPVKGSQKFDAQLNPVRTVKENETPSSILKKSVSTETDTSSYDRIGSQNTGTIKRMEKK